MLTTTKSVANILARSSSSATRLHSAPLIFSLPASSTTALARLICTDGNMAAAGGNNWTWDAVRIYNPDFRLDAKLKPDMSAGTLTAGIVDAFKPPEVSPSPRRRHSRLALSTMATLSGPSRTAPSRTLSVTRAG